MSLQSEDRLRETGTANDKVDYQRFEHPPVDLLSFRQQEEGGVQVPNGTRYPVTVRIYCPDIRVVSRLACVFIPTNPNDRNLYDLSTLNNDIVAYRCVNARTRIARVGEIVGKHGIPLVFPKSNIDGIAFQNEDDLPWIDVELNLGFPEVSGTWTMFYHATSNNKLKEAEWKGYISRVTMSSQTGQDTVKFSLGGG
jgi:hypothetical protein